MSSLRVAVIGVGHLGQHHARLLASMSDVELAGVVDTRFARADEVAAKYQTHAYADSAAVLPMVDAVSRSTCTSIDSAFVDIGSPRLAHDMEAVVALVNRRRRRECRLGPDVACRA